MHYYERNITDIKNEYTEFLKYIMSPLIYEGIKSMYQKSIEKEKECIELLKTDPRAKNPGVLKIFQHFLKNIPTLNANLIEIEMIRIRDSSKHADIFEKLIRAVMKSHIILLTYNASGKQCKLVNEKLHEKIDIKTFIHKIYIECARQFFDSPELFWHGFQSLDLKKNQRESIKIIENAINISIKEMLPMNDIIAEYLRNDYVPEETEQQKIQRLRSMLHRQPEDNLNFFDDGEKKVLLSDDENNELNDDNEYINKNINDIENLLQETSVNNDHHQIQNAGNQEIFDNNDNNNNNNDNNNDNDNNVDNNDNNHNNDNNNDNNDNDNNVDNIPDDNANIRSLSLNDNDYKQKLNNFGQNINRRNTKQNTKQNIRQNIRQNNIEQTNNDDENINIIKNKIDDRNYYTSLLMN